jgi:hypothetical protein
MNPGRHRRRNVSGIVLLVAIAIAMVAGTVAVACHSRNQPEPPDRNRAAAQPEPPRQAEPEPTHGPEPEPTAVTWPGDITWTRIAGIDLPASLSEGPRNRNLGLAAGFAQTPAGAVLAALHLIVRTSYQAGPQVWEPTLRDQVVGPDKAAYQEAVRAGHAAALARGEPADRIFATIRGIRLDAYSPQAASLRVLIEAPTGTGTARAAAVVQVSWTGSDWNLVAPPRGDWSTVRVPVPAHATAAYSPLPGR